MAALALALGGIMALPFALASARANAILEPSPLYQLLPYLGLAVGLGLFAFAWRRWPCATGRTRWLRLAGAALTTLAFPLWIFGEVNAALRIIGFTLLILLLIVPWWFAGLTGPEQFGRRRLLFGLLYWGGFVLSFRLFPSFNETTNTELIMTKLERTSASLKVFGVLALFWLLQVGFVLLVRRVRGQKARAAG